MPAERIFINDNLGGHRFGYGTMTEFNPPKSAELLAVYAREAAHQEGCPIPGEVIELKGPYEAARGYVNNSFIHQRALSLVRSINPSLGFKIDTPIRRLDEVGYFEDNAVPKTHLILMAPLVRNWAPIRLIRESAKKLGDGIPEISSMEDPIKDAARASYDIYSWIARLGETAMRAGVDPRQVLGLVFSKAYFREENCSQDFQAIARVTFTQTTDLWAEYIRLQDANELDVNDIVAVSPE
jgi:hypothetical protein